MDTVKNSEKRQSSGLASAVVEAGITTKELLGISKDLRMAFLKSYYDESEAHYSARPRPFILGGCTMTAEAWLKLDAEWAPILHEFKIPAYRSSDCNASKGKYVGWNGQKKDALRNELLRVIRKSWSGTDICSVFTGCLIDYDIFERVAIEFPNIVMSIYEFGVLAILASSSYAIAKHQDGIHTLGLYFEDGRDVRPHIRKLLKETIQQTQRIVDISFISKADHIPLQVADLFSYESMKSELEGKRLMLNELSIIGAVPELIRFDENMIRDRFRNGFTLFT